MHESKADGYDFVDLHTCDCADLGGCLLNGMGLLSSRMQRFISGPILRLTQHMQIVSRDKNYHIRAEKGGNDEIGTLIDGFNEMLEQTPIRDQELNLQRSRLEELVSMRTAELKVSEEQKNQLLFQQKIQEAYGKIVSLLNSIAISDMLEQSLVDRRRCQVRHGLP